MAYNIHPLFVHFPIALLLMYSLLKVLPLHRWMSSISWKPIQNTFLFVGVLGAFAALQTGEIAEHLAKPNRQLVDMHSLFATASTWIYAALLVGVILAWVTPLLVLKGTMPRLTSALVFIQRILTNRAFTVVLAIVGLITISITGLLGGVMVYGISADPVAPMVLKLLGIAL
jgi:uncharacterized membrane protein